jgi:hypothetical protein
VTRGWIRLHIEELHNFYASPNIVRAIKPRRMRWTGHVTRRERFEMHTVFWLQNLKRGDHLEDLGIDGKIILEWIFRK